MMGLSPRTRGNLGSAHLRGIDTGPIPANAGEPARSVHGVPWCRAYPRERGGTLSVEGTLKDDQGLSPRTRGNQPERFRLDSCAGPIPANAGEPTKSRFGRCGARAYPRERGGTCRMARSTLAKYGLSPRTRGNHQHLALHKQRHGPIPANAGEPSAWLNAFLCMPAYPRERGGTPPPRWLSNCLQGLSPRTRGNPPIRQLATVRQGPIPANAGEPCQRRLRRGLVRAYPRERGGTCRRHSNDVCHSGLSPRTRGNRRRPCQPLPGAGPIPANAGEPLVDSPMIYKRKHQK